MRPELQRVDAYRKALRARERRPAPAPVEDPLDWWHVLIASLGLVGLVLLTWRFVHG